MPRIQVLAGPSIDALEPIEANSANAYVLKTPTFDGQISVFLKDFINENGEPSSTEYFDADERAGKSWSIQFRGRFLKEMTLDDVIFGNVFDRSIKLPYGSSVALKFMKHQDKTLEHDLGSNTPWALAPLITSMPFLAHRKSPADAPLPSFPTGPIKESASSLLPHNTPDSVAGRRSYFASRKNRQAVHIGPSDIFEADFTHGYLQFSHGLGLSLPIGVSFDLMKYWDGRPVYYVCCGRDKEGHGDGPGEQYWAVCFQILEEPQTK